MGRKRTDSTREVRARFPEKAVTAEELRRLAGEIARILAGAEPRAEKAPGGRA